MSRQSIPRGIRSLYYPPPGAPTLADVPRMNYLMVDGSGPPGISTEFQEAIESLYGLAYAIKFGSTDPLVRRSSVMPLEGRFWSRRGTMLPPARRDDWRWTLMIREPDSVQKAGFRAAVAALRRRKGPPALDRVRFVRWREGRVIEGLHLGPYSEERPTINALRAFAQRQGYHVSGQHHEIYLSDPRRARPSKLKTVIRYPVSRGVSPARPRR